MTAVAMRDSSKNLCNALFYILYTVIDLTNFMTNESKKFFFERFAKF
jgi:hypothetical protein